MYLNKTIIIALLTFFQINFAQSNLELITCTIQDINDYTKEMIITFMIPDKDYIYRDFINCSVDDPSIVLSIWKSNKEATSHYDPSFKATKFIFNENFTLSITITAQKQTNHAVHLYCSYYRKSEKKINYISFPLLFPIAEPNKEEIDSTTETRENNIVLQGKKNKKNYLDSYISAAQYFAYTLIILLRNDHKKYFLLIVFFILTLLYFSYLFKNELEKQIKIKELIETILLLSATAIILYIVLYMYAINTPFISMTIGCICLFYIGFMYITKSTKVLSKNIRTFCNILSILCFYGALLCLFKIIQCAD
ncbi:MAG TPA: hypothetical protein VLB80_04130 [Candidatus Babeliales bacterium]|nr:hypothetical protein [Candidatus Babeliales bacterium]